MGKVFGETRNTKSQVAKPKKIPLSCSPYINAFVFLSQFRQTGMGGIGGIAYQDLAYYAQRHGYRSIADEERFIRLVKVIDSEFVRYKSEEIKKRAKTK